MNNFKKINVYLTLMYKEYKIKINDSEISIDSIIGIDLDFNQNNIIFSYNALAFSKFGDLSFRYKLKGLTENWVYTRNRKASFLQLSPGEYEFQIETQNEFGDWLGYDKAIVFIINKPYWKTAWFIGGILLLVLLTLGGILYYYISNLKTEKTTLEILPGCCTDIILHSKAKKNKEGRRQRKTNTPGMPH